MEALFIGVVSGVVASFLFWVGQYMLRPRLVCAGKAIMNSRVAIKVKNRTWLRPLIDVEAALFVVSHPAAPDGGCYACHDEITLKHNKIFELLKRDSEGRNGAWIFTTADEVNIRLEPKDYLRLRVVASDGWFNLRRVFTFDYFAKDIVTESARYESGRSMEIQNK